MRYGYATETWTWNKEKSEYVPYWHWYEGNEAFEVFENFIPTKDQPEISLYHAEMDRFGQWSATGFMDFKDVATEFCVFD